MCGNHQPYHNGYKLASRADEPISPEELWMSNQHIPRAPRAPRAARGRAAGFTLIELMIVVAIVGILAVLAIYGVRDYIANAKTAEATNAVGLISQDAVTAYEREGMAGTVLSQKTSSALARHFCPATSVSVPSSATSIQGRKYQSKPSEWTVDSAANGGFACLSFEMDAPQYYMYSYSITGTGNPGDTYTAQAQGDLNGDGVLSLYSLTGSVTTSRTIAVAPNLTMVRPLD